ncbi:hypothetical protein JKP88DRAFT_283404 [Tribonema minus]|uniref:Uncharacterized protein n=1 Tax=Tribonema minus TaxID=303371 RepID=A0A835YI47_9STRA|nr:hypothetical protein JKP88DRAFT_283404 [Tribonema minus]
MAAAVGIAEEAVLEMTAPAQEATAAELAETCTAAQGSDLSCSSSGGEFGGQSCTGADSAAAAAAAIWQARGARCSLPFSLPPCYSCHVRVTEWSWDDMPGIAASKTLVRVDCDDLEWLPPVLPDWRFYTEELICLSTSWEGAASILGVFAEICVDHVMGLADLSTALQAPSLVVPECNCVPQITPIVESLRLKECNLDRPIIMPVGSQLRTVTVTVCRVIDGEHLNHLFARLPATLRELVVVDVVDPSDYGRYDLQTQDMHVTTFSMPIADAPLPAGLRTLIIGLPEFNQPLGPLPVTRWRYWT